MQEYTVKIDIKKIADLCSIDTFIKKVEDNVKSSLREQQIIIPDNLSVRHKIDGSIVMCY